MDRRASGVEMSRGGGGETAVAVDDDAGDVRLDQLELAECLHDRSPSRRPGGDEDDLGRAMGSQTRCVGCMEYGGRIDDDELVVFGRLLEHLAHALRRREVGGLGDGSPGREDVQVPRRIDGLDERLVGRPGGERLDEAGGTRDAEDVVHDRLAKVTVDEEDVVYYRGDEGEGVGKGEL